MSAPQQVLASFGAAAAATYTTFNPSDKHTNVALSGGNLVASTISANSGFVRAIAGKSSGKWYFEMVLTTCTAGADTIAVGLSRATHLTSGALGYSDADGWALWGHGGSGFRNGGLVLSHSAAQGDVIGFAVDLDNDRIWVSKNNTWIQGNPAAGTSPLSTNLSGTLYPSACPWKAGHVITGRFDPSSHSYSPPSGFTAGWTA